MIIAFGHRSRVGKDTAAELLKTMLCMSKKYPRGVRKLAFAKPLKDAVHIIHGHLGIKPGEHYERHPEDRKIKVNGDKDVVDYWVALGQAVRTYSPTAWLDAALAMRHGVDVLILTDMRFLNEMLAVRALGGTCIRVERNIEERRASDHELEGVPLDAHIQNDGTLADLHLMVEALAVERGWI